MVLSGDYLRAAYVTYSVQYHETSLGYWVLRFQKIFAPGKCKLHSTANRESLEGRSDGAGKPGGLRSPGIKYPKFRLTPFDLPHKNPPRTGSPIGAREDNRAFNHHFSSSTF